MVAASDFVIVAMAASEPHQSADFMNLECLMQILVCLLGHERRGLSASLKAMLDFRQPIFVFSPPSLPIRFEYKELIGSTKVRCGVMAPTYKTVTVTTNRRVSARPRSAIASVALAGGSWDRVTATTSALLFGKHTAARGRIDSVASFEFWKAVLHFLRASDLGRIAPEGNASGRSVLVRFADGKEAWFSAVSSDLLEWIKVVEASADHLC